MSQDKESLQKQRVRWDSEWRGHAFTGEHLLYSIGYACRFVIHDELKALCTYKLD